MPTLSAVLLIFSFQFSLLFFHVGSREWFTQYRTSDVAENVGSTFLVPGVQSQGNDFEFILTVKMKTRHPVGSEFPAICNHCVVIAACSHKTWKFCEQFLHFLGGGNDPLW